MLKPALMLSFSLVALAACQPLATTPVPVPSAVVSSTPQPATTPDTPAVGPVASASPSAVATAQPAPLPTSNPAAAAQASVTLPDGSRLDISLPNRFFEDQGQTLQVSVKLFDASGQELPLAGRKLVFSSSRPQDFSISDQGLITALTDIGFSEIQVRLEGTNLFASQLLSVSSASTFTSGGGPRPTPKPTPTPLEALNVTAGFEGLVTGDFQVNTYTPDEQDEAIIAHDSNGNFVVVWESSDQDGDGEGIYGQRYNSAGVPQGPEFQVNTFASNTQDSPAVAMDSAGNFVVVWESSGQDGSSTGVYAQRYNSAGAPQGSEFQVNTYTTSGQGDPSVAIDAAGNFVIGWESSNQDGGNAQVYAQRYDSAGVAQGAEFRINSSLLGSRGDLELSMDPAGNLVIVFDHSGEIFARRFDVNGRVQ